LKELFIKKKRERESKLVKRLRQLSKELDDHPLRDFGTSKQIILL